MSSLKEEKKRAEALMERRIRDLNELSSMIRTRSQDNKSQNLEFLKRNNDNDEHFFKLIDEAKEKFSLYIAKKY